MRSLLSEVFSSLRQLFRTQKPFFRFEKTELFIKTLIQLQILLALVEADAPGTQHLIWALVPILGSSDLVQALVAAGYHLFTLVVFDIVLVDS